MNRFHEFNWIRTPSDWRDIDFQKYQYKKKSYMSYKIVLSILCVIIVASSIGIVYAYNETFRVWIQQQFFNKDIEIIPQVQTSKNFGIEEYFLYYYHEVNNQEIIDEVYAFDNGRYVLQEIQHKEGTYNSQSYSFDYVNYKDKIMTFHTKGYYSYGLSQLNGNLIYFGSIDNNLCSFNMKTNEIQTITNDQLSVNFSMSPQKTFILINKSDQYWTVYNTKTKQEKRVDSINPYAHNNEYNFISDNLLVTYDDNLETIIIDLNSLDVINLNVQCLYPTVSTFTISFDINKTTIYDHYLNEQYSIDMDLGKYDYSIADNYYLLFNSFEDQKIVIVDFRKRMYKVLDYFGTNQIIDGFVIDNEYFIIYNGKDYYIVELNQIF